METGIDSVADSDNINTSTPWKLRFIKSPVVSSPICKQVDSSFELFVSGLQDKTSSAENSLKEVAEQRILADTIIEQEGHPCDNTVDEKTVVPRNIDKGNTSTDVSAIVCSQATGTLPSAKLWKPVDTSYHSFIVLDETIMNDQSNEEESFKNYDENFAKNFSGILPFNETAKLVHSPKFDATNPGNVTNLILDETNDEKNEVKSRTIKSEKIFLQDTENVTSFTIGQNHNENNTREVEKKVNMQNNQSYSAEVDRPDSVSSTFVTVKLEPNDSPELLVENIGKSEQVICADEVGDRLGQVKSNSEEMGKVKQIKIEQVKSDNEEIGELEQVMSDNLEAGNIEQVKSEFEETEKLESIDGKIIQVKSDNRNTGNIEQVKPDNFEIGKIEQEKSEGGITEKLKSINGKTVQVKSDNSDAGNTKQVKSDVLESGKIEQVKSGGGETEKLKSIDGKTIHVKSDNRDTGNAEQVKSDNLEIGKMERVKPDSGDFVSSDPEENADNNNPEWELLKKLETDEERYKAVRLRWRNLVIPNPNKNLTYRSRGYWTTGEKQKQVSEVKHNAAVTSRKRTHSADPIEHHVPAKRQRTFSCTEVFDRKMLDIHKNLSRERNAILQQHERAVQNLVNKTNYQLRSYPPGSVNDERIRALHVQNVVELRYKCDSRLAAVESESMNQLRTLEKAMEEVRVFNTFYQGLEEGCDDALLLTDEQLMEVLEEDHLYECFAEFYSG